MDGFNRHYRLFRTESARAKHRFETADWHGQQRAQRERIEFYDLRVQGSDGAAGEGIQGRRAADGRVAAGQAALHRPAGRPPPARAGRDLLQLGHHQDPAPHATSTTTSSSCGRPSAPSTSRTTSRRRMPTYRAYYPTRETPGRHHRAHRRQLPAAAPLRGPAARRRLRARGHERAPAPGQAARQLPDPGAVVAVLPQQGRLRGRQDHQRLQRGAVRAADPAQQAGQAGDRRLPVRRGRPADAVLASRGPTSWSTWRSRRPTCSSCAR